MFNESKALIRYLGSVYKYYPAEPKLAWKVDSLVDFYTPAMEQMSVNQRLQGFDEAGIQKFNDFWDSIVTKYESALKECGKGFLVTDKMSIADFCAAGLFFNLAYNDNLPGGAKFYDLAREKIKANATVSAYVERLRAENKTWLDKRPQCGW